MSTYGLIGFPLTHSFSPSYFSEKFSSLGLTQHQYKAFPLKDIAMLPQLLQQQQDLLGLNVTIPYKQEVIPFLDELDDSAQAIGAVNTIKIYRDTNTVRTKGFNTDGWGFLQSIRPYLKSQHQQALVLGTGGAAKAVVWGLRQLGVESTLVSRNPKPGQLGYAQLNEVAISHFKFIINTTPVGMYPAVDTLPSLAYESIGPSHFLYDLVYNPELTGFLKKGMEQKALTLNGWPMLRMQADKAWELWQDPKA